MSFSTSQKILPSRFVYHPSLRDLLLDMKRRDDNNF
jgi:hypothetical protein